MSRLPAFACVLLLAACTGSLFKDKAVPPSVYLLSAGAAAGAPGPQIPADLSILRPRVRTGLESDRVAILYPDRDSTTRGVGRIYGQCHDMNSHRGAEWVDVTDRLH